MYTIMITNEEYKEIGKRLGEIIAKIGPYKRDNFEHALSVMEASKENASWVLNKIGFSVAIVTDDC